MKGNVKIIVLVLIFIVLLGGVLLLQKGKEKEQQEISKTQQTPFFPELTDSKVYRLEINSLQGASLLFRKEAGVWEVAKGKDIISELMSKDKKNESDSSVAETEPVEPEYNPMNDTGPAGDQYRKFYRAKADEVKKLIDKLAGLRRGNQVTADKSKHTQFKVTNNIVGTEVILYDQNMNVLGKLIIGEPDYGAVQSYVRMPDEDAVYQVVGNLKMDFSRDLAMFRDQTIFDIPVETLVKFQLNDFEENRKLTLERIEGIWQAKDTDGSQISGVEMEKIDNVLSTLGSLKANSFVDPNDAMFTTPMTDENGNPINPMGFDKPSAEISYQTADGGSDTLVVGKKEGTVYFGYIKSKPEDYFRISSSYIDILRPKPETLQPGGKQVMPSEPTEPSQPVSMDDVPPEVLEKLGVGR